MQTMLEKIEIGISSENPEDQIAAIAHACINHLRTPLIEKRLEELTRSEQIGCFHPIQYAAIAAQDILGIKKYTGDNEAIRERIDTMFYRNMKQ